MSNKNSIKKIATAKAKEYLNACGINASGLGYSALCEQLTGVKRDKSSAARAIISWYKIVTPGWEKNFKERIRRGHEKHLQDIALAKKERKKSTKNNGERKSIPEVCIIKKSIKKYSHPLLGKKEYSDFYKSESWRQIRYLALKNTEGRCQCCGAKATDGISLHVDHIKPRSRYPEIELSLDNLQVLCDDCNIGKGDWDQTDWRNNS